MDTKLSSNGTLRSVDSDKCSQSPPQLELEHLSLPRTGLRSTVKALSHPELWVPLVVPEVI